MPFGIVNIVNIMADDINKKIIIEVELEAEQLTQNINSLNSAIDGLLAKQQQLNTAGQQNSAAFNAIATQLEVFQKKLQDVNTQVTANTTALNNLGTAGKTLDTVLSSSATQQQKNAQATGDNSSKIKELNQQVTSLSQSVSQQKDITDGSKNSLDGFSGSITKSATGSAKLVADVNKANIAFDNAADKVNQSKSSFDAHKVTMDHLKKSFDEIKDVSGIFGPSLKDAAKGFDVMRSGLKLVQDGFTGVGTAIKADGFEFLLQILQYLFDAFKNSSTGSAILKGAISAIGVIVNKVSGFVHSFTDLIISAFSHPIETLRSFGTIIEQNLINRFKSFGVILDGIIHLDFKKISDGAIQAFTGITNATDKISNGFTAVQKGFTATVNEMATAYEKGTKLASKHEDGYHAKVMKNINKEKEAAATSKEVRERGSSGSESNEASAPKSGEIVDDLHKSDSIDITDNTLQAAPGIAASEIQNTQKTEDQKTAIKKNALQEVEDFAKQSGGRIATDALNILSNGIKQQTSAKISALEKDKASELNNSSLTSGQKLAIQQRYQQQENQIKAKAFKEEQELSIAQAVINGAEAVTKISAQSGVLAPLSIGVVIAETAAQVAKIASQKPPAYAKGGLHYTSDGRGGVLAGYSRSDNTNAYLRSGEGIVVSEAMRTPWARNLVSAINVGFGGRDFSIANPGRGYAVGGIFTDGGDANRYYNQPVNDQKNLANTIAYQMINNFPPVYVDVKDINNQQNILAQTINRVNL